MKHAQLALKPTADTATTQVELAPGLTCGGEKLVLIGGPCAVESLEQMEQVAAGLQVSPVQALRGGAFKPRTSPYSFQGLGLAGLEIWLFGTWCVNSIKTQAQNACYIRVLDF